MCGIVGYVGKNEKKEILLDGLQELEYRGYDSAGIAIIEDKQLKNFKAVGKLQNLRDKTKDYASKGLGYLLVIHVGQHMESLQNSTHTHTWGHTLLWFTMELLKTIKN